jgi:hypothetical protein
LTASSVFVGCQEEEEEEEEEEEALLDLVPVFLQPNGRVENRTFILFGSYCWRSKR